MRRQYSLFQSHLDLAHRYWEQLVQPGDLAIDATCGNGHDTLKLCQLALSGSSGCVYALDIQAAAIESARLYLSSQLSAEQVGRLHFCLGCHSQFPKQVLPNTAKLIVYNLGYLPGGNKDLTTQYETTLQSIRQALTLTMPGGAISISCYPGHSAGAVEEEMLLNYASTLPAWEWSCCHHRWTNRQKAPSLLLLQKSQQNPTTVR